CDVLALGSPLPPFSGAAIYLVLVLHRVFCDVPSGTSDTLHRRFLRRRASNSSKRGDCVEEEEEVIFVALLELSRESRLVYQRQVLVYQSQVFESPWSRTWLL